MSRYRYRAAQPDGRIVSGTLCAADEVEGDALLLARGLQPVLLAPAPALWWRSVPPRGDLAIVFRSLAALVEGGTPLERALAATEQLTAHEGLRTLLLEGRRRLHEGASLASALQSEEAVIPPVVVGMLRAGERGGRLADALGQVAAQLEQEAEIAARVRQALAYPLVLGAVGTLSLAVIATVVVPRFAALLADMGQDLPPATRLLIATSGALRAYGPWALLASGAACAALVSRARTPEGRTRLHEALLGVPVLGAVRHGLASTRFTRALGAALAVGVPVLPALEGGADAAGDAAVAARARRARDRIAAGEPLARVLTAERVLTPSALQLVAIGEASGQLAPMALRAGNLAAAEVDRGLRALVSLLEPALIVLFGGLVALVAAALLQAVYSLRPGA